MVVEFTLDKGNEFNSFKVLIGEVNEEDTKFITKRGLKEIVIPKYDEYHGIMCIIKHTMCFVIKGKKNDEWFEIPNQTLHLSKLVP